MKNRKPWLAFTLSMLCPGLGQLYNGNLRAALVALGIGLVLAVVTAIYLFGSLALLAQAVLLSLVFDLVFAVHAYAEAKRLGPVVLKPFQRWWIYVGFAIVVYGLPDGYGKIFPQRFLSFQIPSESMLPNLLVGDRLVADGWAFWGKDPQRGDIVVFDYPKDPSIKYVKRVIGVPGDLVEMASGELYVNKKLVKQVRSSQPTFEQGGFPFVEFDELHDEKVYRIFRAQPSILVNYGPETVPEGSYFVMGDNRDRSNDSRFWGFVKRDAIVGRMAYVYFSWDAVAGALRTDRLGLLVK
jgi:signal peptidase I